jgi:ribosomal protein S18 acetylase RimI-like enzyme
MYEVNADIQTRYRDQLLSLVKSALDISAGDMTSYIAESQSDFSLVIVNEHTDMVQGLLLARDESINLPWGEGSVYVSILAVRPDAQSQGIGSRLLSALKTVCKERCYLSIWLHTMDNGRLEPFYKRRGFSTLLRIPDYYEKEPDTALLMVCPLQQVEMS